MPATPTIGLALQCALDLVQNALNHISLKLALLIVMVPSGVVAARRRRRLTCHHRLLQLQDGVFVELFPLVVGLGLVDNFSISEQVFYPIDGSLLAKFVLLSLNHQAPFIVDRADLK